MCLYIHTDSKKQIAKKDILVYKVLDIDNENHYFTPYRNYPIRFVGKRFKYESEIGEPVVDYGMFNKSYIEEGIHTYTKPTTHYTCLFKTTCCYAVIPKGSKYYISCNGEECVSNCLIIFKDKEEYELYKKEVKTNFIKKIIHWFMS